MSSSTTTSKGDPNITLSLLRRAHSPDTATRLYTEKILHRPLHLKPTEPNPQLQRRQTRLRKLADRKKKQKPAPLSAHQKRKLCLYDIPKERQKYELYEGLHTLWLGYIWELLFDGYSEEGRRWENGAGRVIGQGEAAKLCAADFHGAKMEVCRSRCVSRVGVKGIVVRDSRGIFMLVTEKNELKSIPKEGTIFKVVVSRPIPKVEEEANGEGEEKEEGRNMRDVVFELHGNQFQYRAADRANRKFKTHFLPDL